MKKIHSSFLIVMLINSYFNIVYCYNSLNSYQIISPNESNSSCAYSGQLHDSDRLWRISGILGDKIAVKEFVNHFLVEINLPGLKTENIIISRSGTTVKIIIKQNKPEDSQFMNSQGSTEGIIFFKVPIQIDNVRSQYIKNILTIIVPKHKTLYKN